MRGSSSFTNRILSAMTESSSGEGDLGLLVGFVAPSLRSPSILATLSVIASIPPAREVEDQVVFVGSQSEGPGEGKRFQVSG
jgi:hypothetical protein